MRERGRRGHSGRSERNVACLIQLPPRSARPVFAAAALLLAAAPAGAQKLISKGVPLSDPVLALGEEDAGPHQFFINNNDDVEVVRFKAVHGLEMCAGNGHPTPTGRVSGYAIKVSWDKDTAIVQPGKCLTFEAKNVKVRAATPLPQDIALQGASRSSNSRRRGRRPPAAAHPKPRRSSPG